VSAFEEGNNHSYSEKEKKIGSRVLSRFRAGEEKLGGKSVTITSASDRGSGEKKRESSLPVMKKMLQRL